MVPINKFKPMGLIILFVAILLTLTGCAESLPTNGGGGAIASFSETEYNKADALRGGRLYDTWWVVNGRPEPKGTNPVWQAVIELVPTNTNGNNGGQWRCKECHGWDYSGFEGAYKEGSTNFTGIRGLQNGNLSFDAKHVFDMMNNGEVNWGSPKKFVSHKYVAPDKLSTQDAYDITKFVMEIARIDNADPTLGNTTRGEEVFTKVPKAQVSTWSCNTTGCHSSNTQGSTPSLEDIITLSKDSPEEFLHKVRFGPPLGAGAASMPFGMSVLQAQDVLAFISAGANTTPTQNSNFDQAKYDNQGRSDVVKGGRLYDEWWLIATNATEPTEAHARWPASNTTITGSATWRCKECHGWDNRGADGAYKSGKHATGNQGIVTTENFTMQYTTAKMVYSFLKENISHGFEAMSNNDDDYYALTKYIMEMRQEVSTSQAAINFIDDRTLFAKNSDPSKGKILYDKTCSSGGCHGADGKATDFADGNPQEFPNEFIHNIAQENPWEFMHKFRFGQPSFTIMPTLYNSSDISISSITAAADLLAYAQTNLAPSVKRGGLLYDEWWNVSGVLTSAEPTTRNKIWVANSGTEDATIISDATTWRCKECHGWDYQGVNGAYAQGNKHYSGIRGFYAPLNTKGNTRIQIVETIKTGDGREDHDFGRFLSDTDIELLADFIIDSTLGIPEFKVNYEDFLVDGNANAGKLIYQGNTPGNCEGCHGANGTTISTVDISAIANDNPPEFYHKVRYGQPNSIMLPSSTGFTGLTLKAASDVLAYVKTIGTTTPEPGTPTTPGTFTYETADIVRGGRLYDKWWVEMQATESTVKAPTDYNPYWAGRSSTDFPPTYSETKKIETSWRCKSCHAWDYKGTGYDIGFPTDTGSDNLLYKIKLRRDATFSNDAVALQQHLYNWIKTGLGSAHQFGTAKASLPSPLGDRELWDLVKFLLEDGLVDSDANILSSGIIVGASNSNGNGLYNGSVDSDVNCSICHGPNGDTPPPLSRGGSGDPLDIFSIAAADDNPWEFLHKIRFGQPGTSMPAIEGTNTLTTNDAYDVLGYAQQSFNAR